MANNSTADVELGDVQKIGNGDVSDVHARAASVPWQDPPLLFASNGILSEEYLTALSEHSARLHHFSIPEYERLRYYNLEHISQELDALGHKVFQTTSSSREDLERLRLLLHDQVNAMRDIEFIHKRLKSVTQDSMNENYNALGRWTDLLARSMYRGWSYEVRDSQNASSRLRRLLTRNLPRRLTWSRKERDEHPMSHDFHHMPKKTTKAVRIIAGLIISISSGASIIVPMVIMSFYPGRTRSLVTASSAILLFGFVLAAILRLNGKEVFVATATYAAVLVVFVGTSGTGGTGNGNG